MSDEKAIPRDSGAESYEPPSVEDLDTSDGPATTAAGGTDTGVG